VDKNKGSLIVESSSSLPVDEKRRDALRRIAKFGAYTAPALVAMLASEKAPAATDA
jgi:hypothetical protein